VAGSVGPSLRRARAPLPAARSCPDPGYYRDPSATALDAASLAAYDPARAQGPPQMAHGRGAGQPAGSALL